MNEKAKNIVLTGATRGMGLSHAHFLAKQGYNLAIIDISKEACSVYGETNDVASLKKDLNYVGNHIQFYECDLTDTAMTECTLKSIVEDFDGVSGLVANAGGDISGDDRRAAGGKAANNSLFVSIENYRQIFDRNYTTCFNSIRAIAPYLKERRYGKIVTTASISAGYGVSQETSYAISKASVIHLTRCAAVELRDYDINVNCIAPGGTMTGRFKATVEHRNAEDREKIYDTTVSFLKKPADPVYISSVVGFLLSRDSDYISGQVIRVDGGQFTSPL